MVPNARGTVADGGRVPDSVVSFLFSRYVCRLYLNCNQTRVILILQIRIQTNSSTIFVILLFFGIGITNISLYHNTDDFLVKLS